jgi:hypothetical protein
MHEPAKWFPVKANRRAGPWSGLLLLVWLQGCAPAQPPLNSERIEDRFGSFGIDVLPSADGIRRSNLYSVHDGERICRTYAVVRLHEPAADTGDAALARARRAIDAGGSLGATLEDAGFDVIKRTRYVGSLPEFEPAPRWLQWMRTGSSAGLAIHVYELYVNKDPEVIDVASIIEVHHPDYLARDDLERLYEVAADDRLSDEEIRSAVRFLAAGE